LARARGFLARAVAADPDRGDVRRDLAIVLMRMDHYPAALALLEQGVDREVVPGDLHNMLAWLLATLPDAALRNGVRALGLAEAVRAADPAPVPNHLGTLAAALAEAGRFEEAAETLGQGVAAALAAGDGPWVGAARERLAAYQAGRPWYSWSH
jgi:Flp pilus assembly protein TadD